MIFGSTRQAIPAPMAISASGVRESGVSGDGTGSKDRSARPGGSCAETRDARERDAQDLLIRAGARQMDFDRRLQFDDPRGNFDKPQAQRVELRLAPDVVGRGLASTTELYAKSALCATPQPTKNFSG